MVYAGNAMNTIPTTSKRIRIPYTVLGGIQQENRKKKYEKLSLLVLNRGKAIFKTDFFREIEGMGFSQVISVESPGVNYDIENVSRKFPFVKFLLLQESCSAGEQINIGLEESVSDYVYVIWNDMKPSPSSISMRLMETLENDDALCTVPIFRNMSGEIIPSVSVPAFRKRNLKVMQVVPKRSGVISLFPFDYCGIYNREKFIYSGGYDYSILNRYWQKMDFGFRVNMWGERIVCSTSLQLSYTADFLTEDTSIDRHYRLFYLKNLAVRFSGDSGYLPGSKFIHYFLRSGEGFFTARKNFQEARKWVEVNRFRFNYDCRSLTELWADPEE